MVWSCPTKCSSQSKKDWKGLVPLPHLLPPPTPGWCGWKREEQSPKTGSTTLCCLHPAQPTSSVDETAAAFADETRNDTSLSSGHLRDARDPVSCEGRARLERAGADQRGGLPPGLYQHDHDHHCHCHPLCQPHTCAHQDYEIMGELEYSSSKTTALVKFQAHKFPYTRFSPTFIQSLHIVDCVFLPN